jgi:hypothetical protein
VAHVAGAEGGVNENARRVLALGVSVGLVGLALFIRGRDDDGGGGGSGGGDGDGTTLVCPPELGDVCERFEDDYTVRVEDAVVTADALTEARTADAVDADVWLVPRPWAEAVSAARELANQPAVLGETSGTIARSPVVLVVQQNRADALTSFCGGEIGWQCVGDVAAGPWTAADGETNWGTVKAGIARPAAGPGLVALGAAVADYLDDPGYASNDFDGGLDNWLSRLAAEARTADRPDAVDAMITGGPGLLAVLGTVEADADRALESDRVQVVVPEPIVTADLVAVPVVAEGDDSDAAADLADDGDLRDALAAAGWRVEDRDLAEGLDADVELPDDPGIPRGDVLRVLLERWQQLA